MEIKIKTAQGVPLSRVAAELGIDRKTARKLRDATADPDAAIVRTRISRFAEHVGYVETRLEAGVPIAQIARDLARLTGNAIPYTSFWEFASKLNERPRQPVEEVRFETAPAQQAQCDWADFGDVIEDGQTKSLSLFVLVLGYSRHTFAYFTTSMDKAMLQRAHQEAFASLGGVPHAILYDNMRTVTTGRDGEGKPIWQKNFADFAGRYGFRPSCARPYRAKTKGKVERTIGFIRRSFLTGRSFEDLADANAQLRIWLLEMNARRHGTHGEIVEDRFAVEKPLLIPLRNGMNNVERIVTRIVDAEGAITYAANVYELPRGYRGRELTVRDDGHYIRIYAGAALVCEHKLMFGRGERTRRREITGPTTIERSTSSDVSRRSLQVYEDLVG